jgi:transcriptional regulator with XRE-family HTH domain
MEDDSGRIGATARRIRRRRGLSLGAAAGLAGISKGYLSKLETGKASFTRRGLIEDLAAALGCSPIDLTGLPAVAPDRRSMAAASAIPGLTAALHDTTIDDVPDVPTRSLAELVDLAEKANAAADQVRYEIVSGSVLGDLITELHVIAARGDGDERREALKALVTACIVARSLAATMGHGELAVTATRRGWDAARRLERGDLASLMAMGRVISLNRVGARHRAGVVLRDALGAAQEAPGPTAQDTSAAEARGMLHLAAAHLAARDGNVGDAETHLGEAGALARFTGEKNFMRYHFGPSNVGAWELAVAVETDRGPAAAERLAPVIDLNTLGSPDRVAAVHFDLARAYAQADGARDGEALRHIDQADRVAPVRIRQDPLARELIELLDRRARRRVWELDSLKNRVGIA